MSTEFERFVEERKKRKQEAEYLRRIAEPFPGAPLIPERKKAGSSNPDKRFCEVCLEELAERVPATHRIIWSAAAREREEFPLREYVCEACAEGYRGLPGVVRVVPLGSGNPDRQEIPSLDTLLYFMDGLKDFTFSVDAAEFEQIFGARLGAHLWGKFRDVYDFDMMKFWASLDSNARLSFLSHIRGKVYR